MGNGPSDIKSRPIEINEFGIKLPVLGGHVVSQIGNDVLVCKDNICENFVCSERITFQNGELKCGDNVLQTYKTIDMSMPLTKA